MYRRFFSGQVPHGILTAAVVVAGSWLGTAPALAQNPSGASGNATRLAANPVRQGADSGRNSTTAADTAGSTSGAFGARGQTREDKVLNAVRFDQLLDSQVPLDTRFRDETGKVGPLSQYFGQRPVVMVLIFYNCTMLCSEVLNGLVRSTKELNYEPGKQFDVVVISINPREGSALAAGKKKSYLADYGRPDTAAGWHFLTGEEPAIKKVADSIGYHYTYDPTTDSYAHPGGAVVITPEGKVARYFYGVDFPERDLKFGLIEASQNKIGSFTDQFLLRCFHYNPTTGKYSLQIMRVVKLVSCACTILMGLFLFGMVQKDRKQQREYNLQESSGGDASAPKS